MKKDEIKSLYAEFMGFLSQIPSQTVPNESLYDESLWTQYNDSVNRLTKLSGNDYTAFVIRPEKDYSPPCISLITLRSKLGGLISKIHAEYFPELPEPFSGKPSVVITQTQQQNQSLIILLEVQSKIDEKLSKYEEGSKEHGFLKKLKSSLPTILNVTQLITTIGQIASECGVTPKTIADIFS